MSTPLAYDAVIFDVDNVLVDTRTSYLDAIRWTIEIILTSGRVPAVLPPEKSSTPTLLTEQDVETFKHLGGFNDDWDCCYGLLTYLMKIVPGAHTAAELRKKMDLRGFADSIQTRPLGVAGLLKHIERSPLVTIEKIGRVFQEVYLGSDLLELSEKRKPHAWKKKGLIHREKLIFKKPILEQLKSMGLKLGIATGRPRFELLYVLKKFHIEPLFDAMTTMDDVRKAERLQSCSLRKPHPFSLLETAKKMGPKKRYLYVGDLPDDIFSAVRAKPTIDVTPAGFTGKAHDSAESNNALMKAGAAFVLHKPVEILKALRAS
ncbi:MAG: HAD hydrolase-like protein [Candidatus Omnitrophica bacterium]|nr:HAD hydrolase-like protein [Candidatus Omnitrophota bacterium]